MPEVRFEEAVALISCPSEILMYVSHSGSGPTAYILQRQAATSSIISSDEADSEAFDPASVKDARERISRFIAQRRGQSAFATL